MFVIYRITCLCNSKFLDLAGFNCYTTFNIINQYQHVDYFGINDMELPEIM